MLKGKINTQLFHCEKHVEGFFLRQINHRLASFVDKKLNGRSLSSYKCYIKNRNTMLQRSTSWVGKETTGLWHCTGSTRPSWQASAASRSTTASCRPGAPTDVAPRYLHFPQDHHFTASHRPIISWRQKWSYKNWVMFGK